MQWVISAVLVRLGSSCFDYFYLFLPGVSASLRPGGILSRLYFCRCNTGRTVHIACNIPSSLMPIAESLGATRWCDHTPIFRNARNWNRGHKTLIWFLLPLDWRGYTATYSALACDLLEQWQWRNTLLPKNAHNVQKGDWVPLLNTNQTNASALAIHLHRQVWLANVND